MKGKKTVIRLKMKNKRKHKEGRDIKEGKVKIA